MHSTQARNTVALVTTCIHATYVGCAAGHVRPAGVGRCAGTGCLGARSRSMLDTERAVQESTSPRLHVQMLGQNCLGLQALAASWLQGRCLLCCHCNRLPPRRPGSQLGGTLGGAGTVHWQLPSLRAMPPPRVPVHDRMRY